jgi:hypothetical protein
MTAAGDDNDFIFKSFDHLKLLDLDSRQNILRPAERQATERLPRFLAGTNSRRLL